MSGIYSTIIGWVDYMIRSLFNRSRKTIRHILTGKSELQRVAEDTLSQIPVGIRTAQRTELFTIPTDQLVLFTSSCRNSSQLATLFAPIFGISALGRPPLLTSEPKLALSFNAEEQEVTVQNALQTIATVKRIPSLKTNISTSPSSDLVNVFTSALNAITSINVLHYTLTSSLVPYDSKNSKHEERLLHLWNVYFPDVRLPSRQSSAWDRLGFQGDDPATDFRAMGTLGLENLIAFGEKCPEDAQQILKECELNGIKWFSFAITGINITSDLLTLTKERVFDSYYYRFGATPQAFAALYCIYFVRFNEKWRMKAPKSVMEFRDIRQEFLRRVRNEASTAHIAGYEFFHPLVPVSQY